MPKVASEVKVAAHPAIRNQNRQADKAGDQPFASLLDTLAPADKPAPKPDRAAPAKESRKTDAADSRSPAEPSDAPAPDADAAPQDKAASADDCAKPEETAAQATDATESDTTDQTASTETTDADKQAALDAALTVAVTQPAPAAAVATTIALAPADLTKANAETAIAAPAIDAAAAAETAAAPVLPQTDAPKSDSEKSDTKATPKAASSETDTTKTTEPDALAAGKQPRDDSQIKPADHRAANAQPDAQKTATAPKETSAEPAAKSDNAPKTAQPVTGSAPEAAPSFPLQPLHAHGNVAAGATAQSATLIANAIPISGVAVEIVAQAKAGGNRFEIRLDPPELGRIDVRLEVDKNGQVTSHLRVDRVETLDMLRRDASTLERALQDAGLKTSDNALNFSLRDQSAQQNAREQNTPNSQTYVAADDTAPAVGGAQVSAWATRLGGIDIRV